MRNSFPGGLAIGSHKDGSSHGHLPLTTVEMTLKSRKMKAKYLAAMTDFDNDRVPVEKSDRREKLETRKKSLCHVIVMWRCLLKRDG